MNIRVNRRGFLKSSAALAGSLVLSGCHLLPRDTIASTAAPGWKLGFKSMDTDSLAPVNMRVQGKIPTALTGNFYRNGPAKYERSGEQYQHWFDGDGMIQKYAISNNSIVHSGQFVHTKKYLEEQQAQRFLYGAAGTTRVAKIPSRNNDTVNVANTSLVNWNGEMLALWEGGSAYQINAESLTTRGLKTWSPELQHMPFSAHPKIEANGEYLWNFGLIPYHGNNGSLIVYKLKKGATKPDYQLLPLPYAGYVHDFAQTQSKLLFYISPYHYSHDHGDNYVQRFKWQPELGGRLIVVDKNNLYNVKSFDAPAGFVFHFGQAREMGNSIQLVASWHKTPELMAQGMYDVLIADAVDYDKSQATLLTLNMTSGKVDLEQSGFELEFPGFDLARSGELVFGVGRKSGSKYHYANSTLAWNINSGKADEYFFDSGIIAEEPLYIADKTSSKANSGWLLQTALNYQKARTEVYVFDALNIASGPLAVASMSRSTPLGFHGTFVG